MRFKKTTMRTCVIAALSLMTISQSLAVTPPKREFRSAWLTTVWCIDWPSTTGTSSTVQNTQKSTLNAFIDNYAAINATGICFQARSMADAMYQSSLAPWSQFVSGKRGTSPGWDPLAYAVEQCHAKGLECYAWLNPYRWSSTGTISGTTSFDNQWQANGWALTNGSYVVLNPGKEECRRHIVAVCREIVEKYDIDGFLFDDYFYPTGGLAENSTAGDWSDYQAYKNAGGTLSIGDWRRDNVRQLMKDLNQMLKETRPDVRFGVAPAGVAASSSSVASKYGVSPCPKGSDWMYNEIYCDPLAWMYDGTIDFISPQIYWKMSSTDNPYKPIAQWWAEISDHFNRHFYSSHTLSYMAGSYTTSNMSELCNQIQANRDVETGVSGAGSIFYSAKHVNDSYTLRNYLSTNVYQRKSLVPVVTWHEHPTYGAPQNASKSGSTLSWTKVTNGRAIIRYSIYAIPATVSLDEAQAADGDGIDGEYLLGVSYNNSYTIPSAKTSGYWYAVCVYDGYGYEYEPALIGYTAEKTPATTLISPANGANVTANATFQWSNIGSGTTYTLYIGTDAECTNTIIEKNVGANTSTTVDLSDRGSAETLYWYVKTQQSGKLSNKSEIRRFVTPPYDDAGSIYLLSPDNGAGFDKTITFEWTKSANATQYTLQVAPHLSFGTLFYETTVTTTSTKLEPSILGLGTYYWRVIASGKNLNPTTSEARVFSVLPLPYGNYEPGYTPKKDPATYPTVDDVKITNLWVRSVKDEYNNITFEEEGKNARALAALGEYVYVLRRGSNASSAQCYLDKYIGDTGELYETIALGDISANFLPGNTLVRDDAGNLVCGNMTLNIQSNPLKLHMINPANGEVTHLGDFYYTYDLSTTRVDHFDVYGDVAAGNYYVFASISRSKSLIRWTVQNGELVATNIKTMDSTYPADAGTFGLSSNIHAITADQFYANGSYVNVARYSFSSGKKVSSFDDNPNISPAATDANGALYFVMDNKYFTVYPSSDYSSSTGYRLGVLVSKTDNFAGMTSIADIPQGGIGSVQSTSSANTSTPMDVVISADGKSARLYFLVAGNGIAAYEITSGKDAVEDIIGDTDRISATTQGLTVKLNRQVDNIELYNPAGVLVAKAAQADRIDAPAAGVYIVRADKQNIRIIIR